jgi:phage N-6-adenine-methyltransferase
MSYAVHPEPSMEQEDWSRDDWCTPNWVLEPIRKFAGGAIGLDPCANDNSIVGAVKNMTREDNSLVRDWSGFGLVFINPPYSRNLFPSFAAKMLEQAKNGVEIIALVPTNCETMAWQEYIWNADAICFLNQRVRFLKKGIEQGSPAGGSALVYFGERAIKFAKMFDRELELGKVVII